MQIPRGPKHLKCPLWKKAMSTCCHACPLWMQMRGQDLEDEWNCALTLLPWLTMEAAKASHQAGASADKVANTVEEWGKQTAKEVALMHNTVREANIINTTILNALPLLAEVAQIQNGGRGLLITQGSDDGGHS